MLNVFRFVADAIVQSGVAGWVPGGDYIQRIAGAVLKQWKRDADDDQIRRELLTLVKSTFDEVREAARAAAVAATPEPDLQAALTAYLPAIQITATRTFKRPDDPTGRSVPNGFVLLTEEALVKLLPAEMPRFREGDVPAYLHGWRLESLLGCGGFGEVWKARKVNATSLVSAFKFGRELKQAELDLLYEGNVINRVMAEGGHPGIVQLQDIWTDGDPVPWLRYEYAGGGDLTGRIFAWQQVSAGERFESVTAALRQLVETVAHFHALGILHRDLKPANILTAGDRYKITDFGIGAISAKRHLVEDAKQLATGRRMPTYLRGSHTAIYSSPQQRDGHDPDPRDDVHALGVIAFQMATGQIDHGPGADMADELAEAGVPAWFGEVLRKCVAAKAERRPPHAGELLTLLTATRPAPAHTPVSPPPPTPPTPAATPTPPTFPSLPVPPTASDTDIQLPANEPTGEPTGERPAYPNLPPGATRAFTQVLPLCTLAGHTGNVDAVALSPDGTRAITGSKDRTAKIWDTATGQCLLTLTGHGNFIRSVAWSPTANLVATGSDDTTIRLWNPDSGTVVQTLRGHTSWVYGLAFRPDGKMLASAGGENAVRLWNPDTGAAVRTLTGHTSWVYAVAFSPDGKTLASSAADNSVRLWDMATGNHLRTLTGHTLGVYCVAFSPDGKGVASGANDNTVRVWDAATGKELTKLTGHSGGVYAVGFSPDGEVLFSGSTDFSVRLWLKGGRVAALPAHASWVYGLNVSRDGRRLATAGSDNVAKVWLLAPEGDPADFGAVPAVPNVPPKPVVRLTLAGNGHVHAGDRLWIRVTVRNSGKGPLSRVWAEVHSGSPLLSPLRTAFGAIPPDTTAERCLAVMLPPDTPPGTLRGTLRLHDGNGFPIPSRPFEFVVKPLPREDIQVKLAVANDGSGNSLGSGDGIPKHGEYVDIVARIRNRTGAELADVFVTVAAKTLPQGTRVTVSKSDPLRIPDGAEGEARVTFAVDGTGGTGRAEFALELTAADGRHYGTHPFACDIG